MEIGIRRERDVMVLIYESDKCSVGIREYFTTRKIVSTHENVSTEFSPWVIMKLPTTLPWVSIKIYTFILSLMFISLPRQQSG